MRDAFTVDERSVDGRNVVEVQCPCELLASWRLPAGPGDAIVARQFSIDSGPDNDGWRPKVFWCDDDSNRFGGVIIPPSVVVAVPSAVANT